MSLPATDLLGIYVTFDRHTDDVAQELANGSKRAVTAAFEKGH
jgi:hypothetical protein